MFLFPPTITSVPVSGCAQEFPVHRVYCVGQNYAEHAREMGGDPDREPPFFFCKPADAIVPALDGETITIPYPPQTANLHHEIELVIAIGRSGSNIATEDADDYVFGYAVGLDMTRRDLQAQMKKNGRPWEISKAFDASAPISPIFPAQHGAAFPSAAIWLNVNGVEKQRSNTRNMIWSVAEIIAHLSRFFQLQTGDLIFTGTPAGVGAVKRGDVMEGGVERIATLRVRVQESGIR